MAKTKKGAARAVKSPKKTAKRVVKKAAKKAASKDVGAAVPLHTITPYLSVGDAAGAIDWYKKAFGAKEFGRMPGPDGKLLHAEIRLGDSSVYLSDIFPQSATKDPRESGASVVIHLWHRNVDKLWSQAVANGAKVLMPLDDQFWGDRYGQIQDPFGHVWSLSHKSKLSKKELERKREEAMAAFGGAPPA